MIERLALYIEFKGLSVRAFELSINASDGMIRKAINNNTDIQSKWIKAIADKYHDINLVWLITGEGEMLRSDSLIYFPPKKEEPAPIYKSDPKDLEIIELQREQINLLNKTVTILESALAQSNLGLGSAHLAGSSTPPLMGIQSRKHK